MLRIRRYPDPTPTSLDADPNLILQFNADPDPIPYQSDENLRPLSPAPLCDPPRLYCERIWPSMAPYVVSIAPESWL